MLKDYGQEVICSGPLSNIHSANIADHISNTWLALEVPVMK